MKKETSVEVVEHLPRTKPLLYQYNSSFSFFLPDLLRKGNGHNIISSTLLYKRPQRHGSYKNFNNSSSISSSSISTNDDDGNSHTRKREKMKNKAWTDGNQSSPNYTKAMPFATTTALAREGMKA